MATDQRDLSVGVKSAHFTSLSSGTLLVLNRPIDGGREKEREKESSHTFKVALTIELTYNCETITRELVVPQHPGP